MNDLVKLRDVIYQIVVEYAPNVTTQQIGAAFSGYGYGWFDGPRLIKQRLMELEANQLSSPEVIIRLKRALKEIGEDPFSLADILASIASDYITAERHQDAADVITVMTDLIPDDPTTQCLMGSVYELLINPNAAEDAYLEAVHLDPECSEAVTALKRLSNH